MESLAGYGRGEGSDEETEELALRGRRAPRTEHRSAGGGGGGGAPPRRDDDTNYDDVTMDMSEDSNNNESDRELPQAEPDPPRRQCSGQGARDRNEHGDGRERDSTPPRSRSGRDGRETPELRDRKEAHRRGERDGTDKPDGDRERSPWREDRRRSERSRVGEGSSASSSSSGGRRGLLGDRPDERASRDTSSKVPALMDLKPFGGEPPPALRPSDDRDGRDGKDARSGERDRDRDRRDRGDRDRERDRDKDRRARPSQEKKSSSRRSDRRTRSRSRERRGSSRDRSDRSRDRSVRSHDRSNRSPERSERSRDRSNRSPDRSARSRDRLDRSRDRLDRSRDKSDRSRDRSDRSQSRGDMKPHAPHAQQETHPYAPPSHAPRGHGGEQRGLGGLGGLGSLGGLGGLGGSSPQGPDYRPSYKVSKKLQVMEKMGLQIKTPDGSMATAQQLMQRSVEEQRPRAPGAPAPAPAAAAAPLPSYYNPNAVCATKLVNQVQKRKLLWGHKGKEGEEVVPVAAPAVKWTGTRFAQDTDGKVASKFMRLMGIKDPEAVKPVETDNKVDLNKQQEEMFQAMQAQYEVARVTTHTMRGVGLGFQRQY